MTIVTFFLCFAVLQSGAEEHDLLWATACNNLLIPLTPSNLASVSDVRIIAAPRRRDWESEGRQGDLRREGDNGLQQDGCENRGGKGRH